MKVIIKKTGKIKEVSDGYAQNFLIPRGLAVPATREAVKELEQTQEQSKEKKKAQEAEWDQIASTLKQLKLTVEAKANEDGTLFGSLPESAIIDRLQAEGIVLDAAWVKIPEHIKHTGEYAVGIEFPNALKASLSLIVTSAR